MRGTSGNMVAVSHIKPLATYFIASKRYRTIYTNITCIYPFL